MTECPLILNAEGFYECSDCNWIYKHKADKQPHRNCPNSPDLNTPEHRETIKQRMLSGVEPTAAITEQLDRCLTPCKEFNGQTCTWRGSACNKWQRWKEFLLLTANPCRHFEASPEQTTH
jgi:hypothetical protein